METQANQQQKTHGITNKHINNKHNKHNKQMNTKDYKDVKAGILNQARRRPR